MNSPSAALTPRDRLIVALDFSTQKEALRMVEAVGDDITFFKIGLRLYTAAGPEVVRTIAATGAKIFLDLKLHDIPSTVSGAVTAAGQLGVQMLTLHLSGGLKMIEAALVARRSDLILLGVTVLTSFDEEALHEIGIASSIEEHVQSLAELGLGKGLDGVIASPHEIQMLRSHFGKNIKIVTPGVRPSWSQADDQKRFMTPREALEADADYLVIGRPITQHKNPREAVRKILDEISA